MTATHDIALLTAALDAGDDSALGPLADALEEAGDARAAGFRATLHRDHTGSYSLLHAATQGVVAASGGYAGNHAARLLLCRPARHDGSWAWERPSWGMLGGCRIPPATFDRLTGGVIPPTHSCLRVYPARSAAFLSLAEALKES